jgi:glycosyltransferase involved in cell wall biosynthesis
MTSDKRPSATVIYHFFHPDDVVSARHFSDFAEDLAQRGWDVSVLTSNRYCRYPERKMTTLEEVWNGVNVMRVRRFGWDQANDILRIANGLWMMIGWTVKLLRLPRTDVIIVGTDPQFSQLMLPALKHLARPKVLAHWCYDLFPEAILADGVQGPVRWLASTMRLIVQKAYRSVDLMVDLGSCMRKRLDVYDHQSQRETLTPWALVEPRKIEAPDPKMRHELFGDAHLALLYSGNMGKAHDFMPFLHLARMFARIDPGIVFCFACRGNRMGELKDALTPRDTNIRLAPFADEADLEKRLNAADIHLLSLRPEWEGIVVPSKFFGSLAVGRPVLYAGPETSSVAEWIRKFDVGLVLTEKNFKEIVDQILTIKHHPESLNRWQQNAFDTYEHHFSRKFVMDKWNTTLRDALQNGRQKASFNLSVITRPAVRKTGIHT